MRVRLDTHFAGKPPARKATWNAWVAAAKKCGPVTSYAQKTRIVVMSRVRFAAGIVRMRHVDVHLWMRRRIEHPLLRRTEDFGRLGYVHHFRLTDPSEIDADLRKLMCEAYRVGTQELKSEW